jgi:hypothetical protein
MPNKWTGIFKVSRGHESQRKTEKHLIFKDSKKTRQPNGPCDKA